MQGGMNVTSRALAAMVIALVILTAAFGAPAAAHHDPTCEYHNETEFSQQPPSCRFFLVDAGVGQKISRPLLAANAALYQSIGIPDAFLWHAPERVRRVEAHETVRWNGCAYRPGPGNGCAVGSVVSSVRTIRQAFGGPVDLTVLEYKGIFVGLYCGNLRDDTPLPDLTPAPGIAGLKFLDRDRDGARDPGEPALAGWRIELHLLEAFVPGFSPGKVAETTTGADGSYLFRLVNLPPGRYRVVEEQRAGWVQTRQPGDVVMPFGLGDGVVGGNDFGNVETQADVVKVAFALVDPPTRFEADQPAELTVRATLRNDGPADIVDVADTFSLTGPEDCAILPRRQTFARRLVEGQQEIVDLVVRVTCTEPSDHDFVFTNELAITTPGVNDPDPVNNVRSFTHRIPVFDRADIAVDQVGLVCPARSDVGEDFICTLTAEISNAGPHAAASADVVLGLTVPPDCTTSSDESTQQDLTIMQGVPRVVTSGWTVTCAERSFHPTTAQVVATLDHLHVEDPNTANDVASLVQPTVVEIFEAADLAVQDLDITCDEHADPQDFTCSVVTTVANHGVATGVATLTDVTVTAPAGCVVSGAERSHTDQLADGETADYTDSFHVTCTDAGRHVLRADARISADEPHAEDRAAVNDTGAVEWLPIDVKPRSFPSAINLRQRGLVPVAILSTATFDAPTEVVQSSLRFGATGTEDSWVRCGAPEDVDDDGLVDLVCHFDTTLTAFTCTSEHGVLTGRLTDGTAFESQDAVKITGC